MAVSGGIASTSVGVLTTGDPQSARTAAKALDFASGPTTMVAGTAGLLIAGEEGFETGTQVGFVIDLGHGLYGIGRAVVGGLRASTVLRFTDDPLADNNILVHAFETKPLAVQFLDANRGFISVGRPTFFEFTRGGRSASDFHSFLAQYDIQYIDDIDYRLIIEEARLLRSAFKETDRVLKLMDSRTMAVARIKNIDFASSDEKAVKRALDLGIPSNYVDLFPGLFGTPSNAAKRVAQYQPKPVTIPTRQP